MKTVLPNADFVIEGYVDPSSLRYDATSPLEKPKRSEGSFGDRGKVRSANSEVRTKPMTSIRHSSFGLRHSLRPVFHVTAISHRKDAVYPATIVGMPPMEDFYIGGASVENFWAETHNPFGLFARTRFDFSFRLRFLWLANQRITVGILKRFHQGLTSLRLGHAIETLREVRCL